MAQLPISLFILLVSAILIWLCGLSFFLYKTRLHYNRLTAGVTKQHLSDILEQVLSEIELSKKQLAEIMKRCDTIEQDGVFHIQKIGVVRFNPFADTGGNQSFVLAILNGQDDGVLLSNLHGRTGTRWYAKKVKEGKGVEHDLSNEEKTAIKNAKTINNKHE